MLFTWFSLVIFSLICLLSIWLTADVAAHRRGLGGLHAVRVLAVLPGHPAGPHQGQLRPLGAERRLGTLKRLGGTGVMKEWVKCAVCVVLSAVVWYGV